MWPMAIVPGDEQRQFSANLASAVGDHEPSRALVLHRQNEPFDDRDAAVFANGFETLMYAFPATPSTKRLVAELLALVGDQVPRTRSGVRNDSAKKGADRRGRVEHGEP
jgi:hypothetical protein